MAMTAVWLKVEKDCVVEALQEFTGIAENKGVKVVLRGVNVGVYKVLKLVRLASRFSFVS